MQAQEQQLYSPEEYLALEDAATQRSEYINGHIVPMAGGTTNHNRIALNISTAFHVAFRSQDYEVFMGDVRLWIPERRIYTYPDVMVIAGEPEYYGDREDTVLNPQVIVEVLSSSTQGYDRTSKFEAYRTTPRFQEYLLVDQTRFYVEHYAKTGPKQWSFQEHDAETDPIAFVSIPVELAIAEIYRKVSWT